MKEEMKAECGRELCPWFLVAKCKKYILNIAKAHAYLNLCVEKSRVAYYNKICLE